LLIPKEDHDHSQISSVKTQISFNEQKISGIAGNEEWNQLTQHAQVINNTHQL